MKLIAIISTEDGRLTAGKIYYGNFVMINQDRSSHPHNLRIAIYDNTGFPMTFDPNVFKPVGE